MSARDHNGRCGNCRFARWPEDREQITAAGEYPLAQCSFHDKHPELFPVLPDPAMTYGYWMVREHNGETCTRWEPLSLESAP